MRARDSRLSDHIEHRRSAVRRMTRLGEFMVACTLLVITLPLMLIVALAIKGESPGPIMDGHACVRADGRRFQILRFRTAARDPGLATPSWAQTRTRIGRFLWSTRIDALPRLINVLRGEISLIDPSRSPSLLNRRLCLALTPTPSPLWPGITKQTRKPTRVEECINLSRSPN